MLTVPWASTTRGAFCVILQLMFITLLKSAKKTPNLGFFDEDTKAEKPHARPHN